MSIKSHLSAMMKSLKQSLAVALIKALSTLPLPLSRFFGRVIGHLNWHFARQQRHFVLTNLGHCMPELSESARRVLAKKSMVSSGMLVAELSATWLWPSDKIRQLNIVVEGVEVLRQAFEKQQGLMILVPHLGNWEIIFPLLVDRYPMAAMYKPSRMPAMDKLIRKQREQNGGDVFPASARGIRQLMKALKQGKITFLLPDQEPAENAGIFVPFFEQPAWTMTLPAKIKEKTDCQLLFACALRTDIGFKVIFSHGQGVQEGLDVEQMTQVINQNMEQLIRLAPEQYLWSYKRFYQQPNGQPQIYLT